MQIPVCGVHMLWQQWTNSHGLQKSCGEKGWHGCSLSQREGCDHSPQHRLLLLFWVYYMRMVLIYYAQVHFR